MKLFSLLSLFLAGAYALTPEQVELIDKLINEQFIPRNNITGVGLSIVENGETVYSKGYGKQDIENGNNATNNTLFSIGSITKSFMGILVVKILSEKYPQYGETVLDLPIMTLAPDLNITFSDRFRSEQMTFRDLLSHRTCLVSPNLELLFGSMPNEQEHSFRTRYQQQGCGHRGYFLYNNGLFGLTGNLIASIAGTTIEELTRDFMLEIGMTNSTTIDLSASYEGLPAMSQGYYQKDGVIHKFNRKLLGRVATGLGAGGILSSSTDMGKYMEFHLNKGKVGDKQIVSEEAMSWLYKPSIHSGAISPKISDTEGPTGFYGYGLGLLIGVYNGYTMIGHDGYWPPYASYMMFYAYEGKSLGTFITTNGPGVIIGGTSHDVVSAAIFDLIRTGSRPNIQGRVVPLNIPGDVTNPIVQFSKNLPNLLQKQGQDQGQGQAKVEFDDVVGLYGNEIAGNLRIQLDGQDTRFLEVRIGEWGIGRLLPSSTNGSDDTAYTVEWKTDLLQHFYTYPPEYFPVPVISIDFRPAIETLYLMFDDIIAGIFVKDATLETFPVIPWDPTSCSPNIGQIMY